jgi:hypothetical protein
MATDAVRRHRVDAEGLPWLVARVLGALLLLVVGIIHLQQFFELYAEIPTIGTLFVLNFVGAAIVCAGLLVPRARLGRWGGAMRTLLALVGIAQAASAFVFLFISERTPVFGFKEPGYDPSAIMASRIAEVATVVFLSVFLAGRFTGRR